MNASSRLLAYRKLVAALHDQVAKKLKALGVDYFVTDSMVVVEIEGQDTVDEVIDALDRVWELRIDSPSIIRRTAFALVGPKMTVRRVGSVLQIYQTR